MDCQNSGIKTWIYSRLGARPFLRFYPLHERGKLVLIQLLAGDRYDDHGFVDTTCMKNDNNSPGPVTLY